ncbi:hypothetical protein BSM4216_1716 [Bacillus smithii]|nr:hypothetical protein BSM4216_1716 [Bacillus smithii]
MGSQRFLLFLENTAFIPTSEGGSVELYFRMMVDIYGWM